MTRSMTGFATHSGEAEGYAWTWDLRSVNGRGLDLRLRLPDWIDGLEAAARKALSTALARGNVTIGLKIARAGEAAGDAPSVARLARVVSSIKAAEDAAAHAGLKIAPVTASDILGLVAREGSEALDAAAMERLASRLVKDLDPLIAALIEMREAEGRELKSILLRQIERIEDLVARANGAAEARAARTGELLRTNVARLIEASELDEGRLAQELAQIAVKSDITEELDRLAAHVSAARSHISASGPKGRKLDFLVQEFNREANTLCAKAGSAELSAVGLDLKAVIDQMREQVANVE